MCADSVRRIRQIGEKAGKGKQGKGKVFAIVSVANGGRSFTSDLCLLHCRVRGYV